MPAGWSCATLLPSVVGRVPPACKSLDVAGPDAVAVRGASLGTRRSRSAD